MNNSTVARNGPAPGIVPHGNSSINPRPYFQNAIVAYNGTPRMNCAQIFEFRYTGSNLSDDTSCGSAPNVTRNDSCRLALELHQDQKVGGQVVDVHAASDIPVTCTTTARPWSATMVLTDGAWKSGAAWASAQTFNTPVWATPAGAAAPVKISFSRK